MTLAAQTLAVLRALSTRTMALALAAIAAAIWVGGIASGSGWTLSFDADLGIPIVFTGALSVLAGWLLWVASGSLSAPESERRAWRALAVVLALLGVEQMLSLHERVDEGLSLSPAVGALPLLALTAVALLLALRLPAMPARTALVGGLSIWAAAGFIDAFDHGDGAVASLLFLAAAPILAVAALAAVQHCRFDPASSPPPADAALRDLLLRVDPTRLAIAILLALAAMLGLAVLYHSGAIPLQTFDLRSQQGLNTFCSIGLMITAGGLALLRGRLSDDPWHAWTLLGLTFLVMSVDDMIAGHQLVGDATGVRGQFVLFPIVIAAGVGWLGCMRLGSAPIRRLLTVGAVAWVASQAIDVSKPEGYFHWWVLPEETLELLGTTLFVIGMLLAVQATAAFRDRRVGSPPNESPRSHEPEILAGGV